MKYSRLMAALLLPLSIVGASNSQATDILAEPAVIPLQEKGQAWDQPLATISGEGELKIKNSGANVPVKVSYEGTISCDVATSAAAHYKNKVEFELGVYGRDVDAKSRVGNLDISACTVTDAGGVTSLIAETAAMSSSKVKVEIESLATDVNGVMVFSEFDLDGKVDGTGNEYKVELELRNGSIVIATAPPCQIPPCTGR